MLSRPFNLHRLTPLHAFPEPDSSSAAASCRDLRAFLRRRLEDLASTDPSSDASQLILRAVEMGHVGIDGLPGAVGYEVEFSTSTQSDEAPVRTARFIFLPSPPDAAAETESFSSFPLVLVNAPTPRLEKDFLDWVEGRFDAKATRTDAATGGAFAPSRQTIHSIVQVAAEAFFSERASLRPVHAVLRRRLR